MLKLLFAHHDMARRKVSVNYKNKVLIKIVKMHSSKNREIGGAATLGGRRFVNRHNNQPKVGCNGGGGDDDDEMQGRQNAWGGFFPVILGSEWGKEKERESDRASTLSGCH